MPTTLLEVTLIMLQESMSDGITYHQDQHTATEPIYLFYASFRWEMERWGRLLDQMEEQLNQQYTIQSCRQQGEWLSKNLDKAGEWTNFTKCFPPEVQTIFVKLFHKEKIAQEEFEHAQTMRHIAMAGYVISLVALFVFLSIISYIRSLHENRPKNPNTLCQALILQAVVQSLIYIYLAFTKNYADENNITETFKDIKHAPYEIFDAILGHVSSVMITWVLVEVWYLRNIIIAIAKRKRVHSIMYFPIGWVLPFVITIIWTTMIVFNNLEDNTLSNWYGYTCKDFWINWMNKVAQIVLILTHTLFLLALLVVLISMHRQSITPGTVNVWKTMRAELILLWLMEITSVLKMFYHNCTIKFSLGCYIVHILDSSQGIFIILLTCFLFPKLRKMVMKRNNRQIAMRTDPHRPRSAFTFEQRVRITNARDVTWMQMSEMRVTLREGSNMTDSDSGSLDQPRENYVRDDARNETQAVVLVVTQADVNTQGETDSV